MENFKIKVEQLNFYYNHSQALFDINMNIPDKQVTALIGPSGCGKTTFLRTLNLMHKLHPKHRMDGKISIDNQSIFADNTTNIRKRIGMVFQKPTSFPISIFDNVAYGVRLHESLKKRELQNRVEWALCETGLWDEVKDKLNQSGLSLSGGQQQRLCIARTIAVRPEVVLFDEPTSALDPASTLKVEELIHKLKELYTIIVVTHNMQQATRISDYTGFFYLGKLIEFDTTKNIFHHAKNDATKDYIKGKFS